MASIKKVKMQDGGIKYQARITWYDAKGERHFKKKVFESKHAATYFVSQTEVRVQQGIVSSRNPIFCDYFLEWYKTYRKERISFVTRKAYLLAYKLLKEYFGETHISKLNRQKYQLFLNSIGKKLSKETVKKSNSLIKSAVKNAVADGVIHRDFTFGTQISWNPNRTRKVQYLSISEIKALITETEANLNPKFVSRYLILAAIFTGAREEELEALTWKDINFSKRTIRINKAWKRFEKKVGSTKNTSSERTIAVNSKFLKIIKQLKVNKQKYVFANPKGKIPTSNALNSVLRKLLSNLGLKKKWFHFYSLRHCHVALLHHYGVDWYAISKRIGHKNLSTTLKVYAYLADEDRKKSDQLIIKGLNEIV